MSFMLSLSALLAFSSTFLPSVTVINYNYIHTYVCICVSVCVCVYI